MNNPTASELTTGHQEATPRSDIQILQPAGWAAPKGYSNGIAARGRSVVIGGQIGWDGQCRFHTSDFAEQAKQALQNIVAVLAEAGGRPEHIIRMTWYVIDKREYLAAYPELGRAYREVIGRTFPAMTAVQVAGLMEDAARVEIEATAVIPD
jgi:enamine deaminase RidA (YjgF/YER057c/UK114 family)